MPQIINITNIYEIIFISYKVRFILIILILIIKVLFYSIIEIFINRFYKF